MLEDLDISKFPCSKIFVLQILLSAEVVSIETQICTNNCTYYEDYNLAILTASRIMLVEIDFLFLYEETGFNGGFGGIPKPSKVGSWLLIDESLIVVVTA